MKLLSNRKSYEKRRRMPEGSKTKNPKVVIGSLAAIVISVLVLCMVIVIGVIGFSDGQKETASGGGGSENVSFHVWFTANSAEVTTAGDIYEMKSAPVIKEDICYLPVDGVATVLSGSATYDKDSGAVKLNDIGKRVRLKVGSDKMKVSLIFTKTLDAPVYEENGVVFVPLRSFFEGLGYGVEYTAEGERTDVFEKSSGKDEPPKATFTTDKDLYTAGEKVTFTVKNSSPQDYEIVEEKWENQANRYFKSGEVKISYSVKDYKGNWSKVVSKTIAIEGEYHPADRLPVLAYFYIAEDSDDISKTVKEEKEVKKKVPLSAAELKAAKAAANGGSYAKEKEITTTEKVDKLIKGKYYGNDMVISLEQFKDEMNYLADNGYQTLTVSDYLDYADSGVMPPEKSVMLLFINGYDTTYDLAYPVLKEYGFKANIAPEVKKTEERSALIDDLNNGKEGAEEALSDFDDECSFPAIPFSNLKEMTEDGTFEIGCTGYDSNEYGEDAAVLAAPIYLEEEDRLETEEEYKARVKSDVTAAITVLCDNLGEGSTPFFVYPFGDYSDILTGAVKNAGFSAAFTKGDGYIYIDTQRYALGRLNVTQDTDIEDVL